MKRALTVTAVLLGVAAIGTVQAVASPQESTTTKTQSVVHFEVLGVSGNMVTVKTDKGARDVTVDDSFRFTVDGQPVSVHDLKPGMKGTATLTTTTTSTPVVITEIHNGRVERVAGNSIIVSTPTGFRMFTEQDATKRGAAIIRNGQPADFTSLRTGDMLTATVVTEHPPKVVTKQAVDAAMTSPAAPAAPATRPTTHAPTASADTHAAAGTSGAEGTMAAGTPHRKLPKTASPFAAIGLSGVVLCGIALMLGVVRRRAI